MAKVFQPEIILCDLRLPGITGLDVAQAVRANPDTRHALIAIHSAISDMDLRSLERGIDADFVNLFLSKPLTSQKLASLLLALDVMRQPASFQPNREAVRESSRRT
jgi:CheY-like chemotaxis protein